MEAMIVVWAVLTIVFFVAEGAIGGLASIWFAAGALIALAAAYLETPIWQQIAIFAVVSGGLFFLTRPLARKYARKNIRTHDADKVIGTTVKVTERINNVEGTGEVSVGKRMWIASGVSDDIIEPGSFAVVQSIDGVRLIVSSLRETKIAKEKDELISEPSK